MISINENCTDAKHSAYGWINPWLDDPKHWIFLQVGAATENFKNLEHCLTHYAWSPSHYHGAHRLERHFKDAEFIGLDFDGGVSLQWAIEEFKDYACLIGTTKSHQLPKNGKPACDRFRVVLKLGERVTSLRVFKATAKFLINRYKADPACSDGARFFFPCQHIVFIGPENGETIFPAPEPKRYVSDPDHKPIDGQGRYGPAIKRLMSGAGKTEGERNTALYKAASALFSPYHNLSLEAALSFVKPYTSLDDAEVVATLSSARRKAQG